MCEGDLRVVSSVMVTFHSGKPDVVFAGMKRKPESKPFDIGWHGESAVDCVTVWLPGEPIQTKLMTVPLLAVTFDGMNWKMPPGVVVSAPTWIYRVE